MTSVTRALPSSATVAVIHICATRSSLDDRAETYAATAATTARIPSSNRSIRRRRLGPPSVVVMTGTSGRPCTEPGSRAGRSACAVRVCSEDRVARVPAGADLDARQPAAGAVARVQPEGAGGGLAREDVGRAVPVEIPGARDRVEDVP